MADQPTKVVLRRGIAFLIDTIPGFFLYWRMVQSFGEKVGEESGTQYVIEFEMVNGEALAQFGNDIYLLEGGDLALVSLVMLAYWIGIFVVWQGLNGATLGKSLVGIRTVRRDGSPCGVGRAAVRWLLLIVDAFFYLFPVVGLVTALASRGNRRVGDMAADTYVVKASAAGQRVPLDDDPPPPPAPQAPGSPLPPPSAPPPPPPAR